MNNKEQTLSKLSDIISLSIELKQFVRHDYITDIAKYKVNELELMICDTKWMIKNWEVSND